MVQALARHYRRVRAGLGFAKTPEAYGAFPTDPYSHTPRHAGAQQPGMTGQVKEEILTRFGELGVEVDAGRVSFRPRLLESHEFAAMPAVFEHFDRQGRAATLAMPANGLAFTLAGTPIVYERAESPWIVVTTTDGATHRVNGDTLDETWSHALLSRGGTIARVDVGVDARALVAE